MSYYPEFTPTRLEPEPWRYVLVYVLTRVADI